MKVLGIMLLLLIVVILSSQPGITEDFDDRTSFICWEEKCLAKISLDSVNTVNAPTFHSVESCRLTCGKHGNLLPLPTIANLGKKLVQIDLSNMKLLAGGSPEVKAYLRSIFEIFRQNLKTECGGNAISPSNMSVYVVINVHDKEVKLDRHTNESYKLAVTQEPGRVYVTIYAETAFGARHALETLSQLTSRVNYDNSCSIYIISANIEDKPVFKHRGILIDTSRHFIPVRDLERTLGAMAANKLNVLHWHATDSHSFPLLLSKIPLLARLGAYSGNETYTESDIKHLVEYAKLRGIRILMEIDSPAHASNGWQFGNKAAMGNLVLCRNHHPWEEACMQPPCGQLNPANPNVYNVLGLIYKNLQELIPTDDMFHMGGDEVAYSCWEGSSEVKDYMLTKGYALNDSGFKALWAEFHNRALKAWDNAIGHSNTKIILWTSDLTDPNNIGTYLDKDRFIIEAWTSQTDPVPHRLLKMGYEVIYASVDAWYLDHGFNGGQSHSWKDVYDNRIPRVPKVLGGEAALWSEIVDSNNLDTRLWPRAAALAERLWSNPNSPPEDATYRLMETRNRLIRRGVQVSEILPEWCYLNEGRC
ncbi:chitooligosaccharidolytic beta-N-acetylglucosaminidase isoform X2 [Halyomorpha halys]|uniref:chitooligosaccharidolytic beta-N-acetylglucosaminidase isoform X2 n=1 Tax=Halyomorpha halys TaxID=286706 RepID=UPI0034D1C00D